MARTAATPRPRDAGTRPTLDEAREHWRREFRRVRNETEARAAHLSAEDQIVQFQIHHVGDTAAGVEQHPEDGGGTEIASKECLITSPTAHSWNRPPRITPAGPVLVPESVANVVFGGPRRNRLFICATTSLYSVFLNTRAAPRAR